MSEMTSSSLDGDCPQGSAILVVRATAPVIQFVVLRLYV
jgi:hypothetical protein